MMYEATSLNVDLIVIIQRGWVGSNGGVGGNKGKKSS